MTPDDWNTYMGAALELAREAEALGEVPVGAVIVRDADGAIIGRGCNRRETGCDATAHAELLAIRDACASIGQWRLNGCTLFVTLEPCPMCTGAVIQSRIGRVIFGAFDPTAGCCGSVLTLSDADLGSHPALYGGVREVECRLLLTGFFASRRQQN